MKRRKTGLMNAPRFQLNMRGTWMGNRSSVAGITSPKLHVSDQSWCFASTSDPQPLSALNILIYSPTRHCLTPWHPPLFIILSDANAYTNYLHSEYKYVGGCETFCSCHLQSLGRNVGQGLHRPDPQNRPCICTIGVKVMLHERLA